MKLHLQAIPAVLSVTFFTGCASGPGTYDWSASSYDDSTARNQWEADARMGDWLNEQSVLQETAAANQATVDAANAAAASAAASAAVGIGQ